MREFLKTALIFYVLKRLKKKVHMKSQPDKVYIFISAPINNFFKFVKTALKVYTAKTII